MNRLLLLLIITLPFLSSCSRLINDFEAVLPSPDSKIHIYFNLNHGEPYYLVYFRDDMVIDWSLLGFTLKNGVKLSEEVFLNKTVSKSVVNAEKMLLKGGHLLHGSYNEFMVYLEKKEPLPEKYAIIFRAYNSGIAISYLFTEDENTHCYSENTQFDLFGDDSLWKDISTNSTEDEIQHIETDYSTPVNIPVRFSSQNGIIISISETDLPGYPEMKLKRRTKNQPCYSVSFADNANSDGFKANRGVTPWRVITLHDKDNQIIINSNGK